MTPVPAYKRTAKGLAATLAFVWLGCVVFVLLEQVSGLLTLRDFGLDPLQRVHVLTLYYYLPWVAFAPLLAIISHRFPIRPDDYARPLIVHLVLLMVLSLVHAFAIGLVYHDSARMTDYMATFEPWQHAGREPDGLRNAPSEERLTRNRTHG